MKIFRNWLLKFKVKVTETRLLQKMRYFCRYKSIFMQNCIPCLRNAQSLLIFIAMPIKYKTTLLLENTTASCSRSFCVKICRSLSKIRRLVKRYHCRRTFLFDCLIFLYFQLCLTFVVFQKLCQAYFVLSTSSFKVKLNKQTNTMMMKNCYILLIPRIFFQSFVFILQLKLSYCPCYNTFFKYK